MGKRIFWRSFQAISSAFCIFALVCTAMPAAATTTVTTQSGTVDNGSGDGTFQKTITSDGTTTTSDVTYKYDGGETVTSDSSSTTTTASNGTKTTTTLNTTTTIENGVKSVTTSTDVAVANPNGTTTHTVTEHLPNNLVEINKSTSSGPNANGVTITTGTLSYSNGTFYTYTTTSNSKTGVTTTVYKEPSGATKTVMTETTKNGNTTTSVNSGTNFNGKPLAQTTSTTTIDSNVTSTDAAFLSAAELAQPLTASQARYLLNRVGFAPTQAEINAITGVPLGKAVSDIVDNADTMAFAQPLPSWTPWSPSKANPINPATGVLESDYQSFNTNYIAGPACRALNLQSATSNCTNFSKLTSAQNLQMVTVEGTSYGTTRALFRDWWAGQLVLTKYPLAERMVLFWHNLFPASDDWNWEFFNTDMAIRTQALGNFKTLVDLMIHDASILNFLGQNNSTPSDPTANLAREMMELFTVGINGGYTQNDVDAVSYALTGLTTRDEVGVYFSTPQYHYTGQETILGQTGSWSPDDVVDILFCVSSMPASVQSNECVTSSGKTLTPSSVNKGPGPYIVGKLWAEFVSLDTQNHTSEINTIATTFQNGGWAIRPVLYQLFTTKAFWSPSNYATLVKSPAEFITGIVRSDLDRAAAMFIAPNLPSATNMASLATTASNSTPISANLVSAIWGSGETWWMPPNVKGFLTGTNWINTSTLPNRQFNSWVLMWKVWFPELIEPKGFDVTKVMLTPAQYTQLTNAVVQYPPMLSPPSGNISFINAAKQAFGDPAYWLK
jgi:uncharacterized protein (DUF1800 family)